MKKLLAIFLFSVFILATCMTVFAVDENDVPVTQGEDTMPSSEAENDVIPPEEESGMLSIETTRVYSGMDSSYANGYVPTVRDGKVTIVLPLVGQTKDDMIIVTPDIGTEGPFEYANYRFNVKEENGVYPVKLTLPLKADRQNGLYPVVFNIEYQTSIGYQTQMFTVYVRITDGKIISAPELFISTYEIDRETINGGEEFTVTVTITNIGGDVARNVKLTYSGIEGDPSIIPSTGINTMLINSIEAGRSKDVDFTLTVSPDALAGNQVFVVTLEYADKQGTPYMFSQNLRVKVVQPTEISIDEIALPDAAESGESIMLPISILNTGKSPITDIVCKLEADGLFGSSLFIGEIPAGTTGYGEMKIFVGTLSNDPSLYGVSVGNVIITYIDASGTEYTETVDVAMEILEPSADTLSDTENDMQMQMQQLQPVSQWYVSVIIGCAVIAIAVAVIIVVSYERKLKMR